MLSVEEIECIERYSVERQRLRYSTSELWDWLIELSERQITILRWLSTLACLSHKSYSKVWQQWKSIYTDFLTELNANYPMIEAIAWHLAKRGDNAISGWMSEFRERDYQAMMDGVWASQELPRE